MRQGQGSQRFNRPRRVDMSLRKGTGVGALLMGLVGFGLGLFFGWLLHRERVSGTPTGDRTTAALADTSARLELADQDVIDLRAQLTDAQHLLDEQAATIAQLETELMAYRDRSYGEEIAAEPAGVVDTDAVTAEVADAPADAASAPDTPLTASQFDVDEVDTTDELLVPRDPLAEAEIADEVVAQEVIVEDVVVEEPPAEDVAAADELATDDVAAAEELPAEDVAPAEGLPAEYVAPAEEPAPAEAKQPDVAEAPVDGVLLDGAGATTPAAASSAAAPSDDTSGEGPFVPPPTAEHDDLRRIRGIGPTMERLLNEQGIMTFRQLAVLSDDGIEELQRHLPGVTGRIRRGQWIQQARDLHVQTHGDQP
jgi:predicted flap endonuclease-1-like 5' DNA nuclease